MVEHPYDMRAVAGSSPASGTTSSCTLGQFGKTPLSQSGGTWFESRSVYHIFFVDISGGDR